MDCNNFILWYPKIKQRPTVPAVMGKYKPLFPVYAVSIEGHSRAVWYWLWECSECHNDRVMTRNYILYDNCTCADKSTTVSKFPVQAQNTCMMCGLVFTYTKLSAGHNVQCCSETCRTKAKQKPRKKWSSTSTDKKLVKCFDRVKVCTRPGTFSRNLCDRYHECATHRTLGSIGPHYREGGECYVCTGV